MEKLLAILTTLALETFWDRESDLEQHLANTKEITTNSKLFAYGDVALHYGDLFNYVFKGEVSEALHSFSLKLVEARNSDPEAGAITVYTWENPETTIYVSDLMEVLAVWAMNQPS